MSDPPFENPIATFIGVVFSVLALLWLGKWAITLMINGLALAALVKYLLS